MVNENFDTIRGPVETVLQFFDLSCLVCHELVRTGQSVTGQFYVQGVHRLRDAVRSKRRDSGRQGQWFLHHDNAPSHTWLVVQLFLAEKDNPVITQPPYSPDLVPIDFWLFRTLEMGHNGTRFATIGDIKSNRTTEIRKTEKEAFRRCFQQW
jgi:hypothetical protein